MNVAASNMSDANVSSLTNIGWISIAVGSVCLFSIFGIPVGLAGMLFAWVCGFRIKNHAYRKAPGDHRWDAGRRLQRWAFLTPVCVALAWGAMMLLYGLSRIL